MVTEAGRKARFMVVGRIVGPHGIRGELKVAVMSDHPGRFRPGSRLYLGTEADAALVEVLSSRRHHEMMLVTLTDVGDRSAAEQLRDQYLLIPETEAMPLAENENFAHDLIGLTVETTGGELLGRLVEILFTRANDVYVVQRPCRRDPVAGAARGGPPGRCRSREDDRLRSRRTPLDPRTPDQRSGVTLARLLAAIRDPRIASPRHVTAYAVTAQR